MIIYDETIHVPVRGAANASKGIRFSTRKNGEPKKLIAETLAGHSRRYHILEVFDPGATPKAHYHGPGAYLFVVLRSDLEDAERFAARDPGSDAGAVHAQAGPDQGLGAELYSAMLSEESDPGGRWFHHLPGPPERAALDAVQAAMALGYGIERTLVRVHPDDAHVDMGAPLYEAWTRGGYPVEFAG